MGMAERIKELRLAAGMSQEELGLKLGLGKSAIAKYENGRVKNIKQSTIKKWLKYLTANHLTLWDSTMNHATIHTSLQTPSGLPPALCLSSARFALVTV